jgi:hypothetical protein
MVEVSRRANVECIRKLAFKANVDDDETKKRKAEEEQKKTDDNELVQMDYSSWSKFYKKKKRTGPKRRKTLKNIPASIVPVGVTRLMRFIGVMDIFKQHATSSQRFKENDNILKRLISSHLHLIVGIDEWKNTKTSLYKLIDSEMNLSIMKHLIWITARQSGKTTTIGLFIAVLSWLSVAGGELINVYHTAKPKAQAIVSRVPS